MSFRLPRRADDADPHVPDHGIEEDRRVGTRDLTEWRSTLGRWMARLARAVSNVLGSYTGLAVVLAIGAAVAALMTYLASEVYEAVTDEDGLYQLDEPILDAALELRSPVADTTVTWFTHIGGTISMPIITVAVMVFLAIRRRRWTPVILIAAASLGSLLMTVAGKELIGRTRPDLADAVPPYEDSPSFPSGHALNATVIAGIIAYVLILRLQSRAARITAVTIAVVFAITMGLSRVFLGHHWFTDVVAAWALGLAWLAVVITVHRLYLTAREREVAEEPEAQ